MSLSASDHRRRTSGTVLIITLAALAVMTVLLLALLHGVSHQMRGAQGDAASAREKLLADSAVQLVIGQIEQASASTNQTWISQPGLLRTYDETASRVPTACYKLYSTASLDGMVDTSGNLNFLASDVPANWSSETNQYTDLNAPALTPGLFPQSIYPILNSAALTNAANAQAGTQITGVSSDTAAVTMPVAWLYQLQDGTLGPASSGTAANPIVARLAFWADDDTCKININTAGCGTPWNTPYFNSTNDVAWSTNQPVAGQYSEYPGHPATTSLALVFGTNAYSPQQLLGLTPRYTSNAVPAKTDRLYASLDELCFNTNLAGTPLQRQANPISPAQLDTARFVLTAHSVAPETTLLGEPRIAIWPVADSTSASAPRMTATDNAITNDATVGEGTTNVRSYFFQRHNEMSPTDDLNTNIVPANAALFNDLVTTRANAVLPGYGTTFAAKYPGAEWTQIALEIADYIRCINAVDPSPAPFVSYAAGNPTGSTGYGFVDPLTTVYAPGTTNQVTLRGLGRCPTLSSVTLVFYVCGFTFDAASKMAPIDFETTPDLNGSYWAANLAPNSPLWEHVTGELVRAFVVPCTFQPGCAYPEVSDACTIQIAGLNGIGLTTATSNDFGFKASTISDSLSQALSITPTDRAWGGNEGPLAWRAAAFDAQQSGAFTYAFAGTVPYQLNLFAKTVTNSQFTYSATTGLAWPKNMPLLTVKGASNLTATILDGSGNTLQTLLVSFPAVTVPTPTVIAQYSQDGAGNPVAPSYYMTLKNRVLLTGTGREFLIQPGDSTRSVEAGTDLRVIAGLASVPAAMFPKPTQYLSQAVAQLHNLHFADGTAAYGSSGTTSLVSATYATDSTPLTWTNWCNGSATNYSLPIRPPCSCPTTATPKSVVSMEPLQNGLPSQSVSGDWDTGPGLEPDGALINLPDSGTTNLPASAYFSLAGGFVGAPTQRTPNALVPSPVIFGSLPAGINPSAPASSEPWRTLLFCPYPAGDTDHPGFASPPDHLVLDNFWMPVVEPYAISTRMATAGKINLNDQIAPFTYLHRNTALRALLDDLRVPAVPTTAVLTYKAPGTPVASVFWNPVDEDATVAQIESKFTGVDAYLSESEICTVPIVPQGLVSPGTSVANAQTTLDAFWNAAQGGGRLTGDNLRELPYAQLYGRLTTRSNSYTVHVRVQVLQKLPNDPQQGVWNEGVDRVLGDWRGSYEIERYLDPAASAPLAGQPLGPYKFRVVSSRRFAP